MARRSGAAKSSMGVWLYSLMANPEFYPSADAKVNSSKHRLFHLRDWRQSTFGLIKF